MRTRLIIVFLVPLGAVLLVLGGAYAWTATRSIQQQFYTEQLGDLSYFVTSARQALRAGNSAVVAREADRYQELYGTEVVVIDRSGEVWAHGGTGQVVLDDAARAQARLALSGRRSDLPQAVVPWSVGDAVMVEPVFDDGDVIGAVLISASADDSRAEIIGHWIVLAVTAVLATLLGVVVVGRLAHWVLRPVHRLDNAMEAIERGDIEARIADDTGPPELRRMIRVFNSMADEIEHALTRQQEFAQNASHELRNPLGALLVRVESLATGLDASWEDDIEATREEGRRMTRILDTLLRVAQSGQGSEHLGNVDLVALVHRRVEAWADVATAKGVRLVASADAAVTAVADTTVLEAALDAVIDNAVKFSPPGASVEVSASAEGEHGVLTVRDHGPGLADDERAHASDRFWRSAGAQNVAGSGLGLAIATDLLRSVHGELDVAAAPGGGLQVRLRVQSAPALGSEVSS